MADDTIVGEIYSYLAEWKTGQPEDATAAANADLIVRAVNSHAFAARLLNEAATILTDDDVHRVLVEEINKLLLEMGNG